MLYLSLGEPREPADSYGTPEGHNVRYDDRGQIIALTLVNAKWLLERDGNPWWQDPGGWQGRDPDLVQRNPNTGGEIDFVGPLIETPIESKYVSQKWMTTGEWTRILGGNEITLATEKRVLPVDHPVGVAGGPRRSALTTTRSQATSASSLRPPTREDPRSGSMGRRTARSALASRNIY